MTSDHLEVDLYLDDIEEGEEPDLYVTCRDRSMLKFDRVTMNPVRYHGTWSITHHMLGRPATSYLPADDVWYFTVVHPAPTVADGDDAHEGDAS